MAGVTFAENNFGETELLPQYHSIVWYFASTTDHQSVFRDLIESVDGNAGSAPVGEVSGAPSQQQAAAATAAAPTPTPAAALSTSATNTPPVAVDRQYTAIQNAATPVAEVNGLLSAAVDHDGDALVAELTAGPQNGHVSVDSDGSFLYTPEVGFTGQDRFSYVVSDGLAKLPAGNGHPQRRAGSASRPRNLCRGVRRD